MGKSYVYEIIAAGYEKSDLDLYIEENKIYISVKKNKKCFVGCCKETDEITAELALGILKITVKMQEKDIKKIEIK